jgi:cellulose synthase/poly-beta-1,6-N-acetylglucosamine synthase-like glycosyltransferase
MVQEILLLLFCGIFGIQFLIVLFLGLLYSSSPVEKGKSISGISVIIPFRNEEQRIKTLLESINSLEFPEQLKIEFIFIDDHSTDHGIEIINERLKVPFKLLVANENGKKSAIRQAISHSNYNHILTWDADIMLPKGYLRQIAELDFADMWILPVEMKGKNVLGKLASVDFSWLQILTYVTAIKQKPILNNGANLLFSKTAFLKVDSERTDYDIASGDDIFLLQAFQKSGKIISTSKNKVLKVQTFAPSTIKELFAQRKRWTNKMKGIKTSMSEVLTLALFFSISFSIACIFYLISNVLLILFIPLGMKYLNEYIMLRYHKGFKDFLIDVPILLIHQFFFPIYLLMILLVPKSKDKRWDR